MAPKALSDHPAWTGRRLQKLFRTILKPYLQILLPCSDEEKYANQLVEKEAKDGEIDVENAEAAKKLGTGVEATQDEGNLLFACHNVGVAFLLTCLSLFEQVFHMP